MSADVDEVRSVISSIFGNCDNIPVFDQTAYNLPLEYWKRAYFDVLDYETNELQWTTLIRIEEIARKFEFDKKVYQEICEQLQFESVQDVTKFFAEKEYREIGSIDALNEHLLTFLSENGMLIEADRFRRNQRQRRSMERRKIVRDSYKLYYQEVVSNKFKRDFKTLDFPKTMVDRCNFTVYSPDYFTYMKDVEERLKDSVFHKHIETDRAMYTRQQLDDAGYSADEIAMYLPTDLDTQFDFIKNRSILSIFKEDDPDNPGERRCTLTNKPKKTRDGSGYSYIWREDGITYRFAYKPPKGRPVALMVYLNMQERVWKHIKERHPEYIDIYDKQFLKDSNFIPSECVHLYKRYEKNIFNKVVQKVRKVYVDMMNLNGFTGVDNEKIIVKLSQIEICWNNPLPIDPGTHLWIKYDKLRSIGLNPTLDANTPLMVTEFYSDVDTNSLMFAHKEYRKSKEILRSELIFKSGLDSKVVLPGYHLVCQGDKSLTLSDYAFLDLEMFEQYLYYHLHYRYQQMLCFEEHGYYNWRNAEYIIRDDKMRSILSDVLTGFDDLPDWLKDVSVFDSLVDQDYITRSFFRDLSDKEYRNKVRDGPFFRKISHGRYRLIHSSVPEYRKVRNSLSSVDLPAVDYLLQK